MKPLYWNETTKILNIDPPQFFVMVMYVKAKLKVENYFSLGPFLSSFPSFFSLSLFHFLSPFFFFKIHIFIWKAEWQRNRETEKEKEEERE